MRYATAGAVRGSWPGTAGGVRIALREEGGTPGALAQSSAAHLGDHTGGLRAGTDRYGEEDREQPDREHEIGERHVRCIAELDPIVAAVNDRSVRGVRAANRHLAQIGSEMPAAIDARLHHDFIARRGRRKCRRELRRRRHNACTADARTLKMSARNTLHAREKRFDPYQAF